MMEDNCVAKFDLFDESKSGYTVKLLTSQIIQINQLIRSKVIDTKRYPVSNLSVGTKSEFNYYCEIYLKAFCINR